MEIRDFPQRCRLSSSHRPIRLNPHLGIVERPPLARLINRDVPLDVVLITMLEYEMRPAIALGSFYWNRWI